MPLFISSILCLCFLSLVRAKVTNVSYETSITGLMVDAAAGTFKFADRYDFQLRLVAKLDYSQSTAEPDDVQFVLEFPAGLLPEEDTCTQLMTSISCVDKKSAESSPETVVTLPQSRCGVIASHNAIRANFENSSSSKSHSCPNYFTRQYQINVNALFVAQGKGEIKIISIEDVMVHAIINKSSPIVKPVDIFYLWKDFDCQLENTWRTMIPCSSACVTAIGEKSFGVSVDVRRVTRSPRNRGKSCEEVAGERWNRLLHMAVKIEPCHSSYNVPCSLVTDMKPLFPTPSYVQNTEVSRIITAEGLWEGNAGVRQKLASIDNSDKKCIYTLYRPSVMALMEMDHVGFNTFGKKYGDYIYGDALKRRGMELLSPRHIHLTRLHEIYALKKNYLTNRGVDKRRAPSILSPRVNFVDFLDMPTLYNIFPSKEDPVKLRDFSLTGFLDKDVSVEEVLNMEGKPFELNNLNPEDLELELYRKMNERDTSSSIDVDDAERRESIASTMETTNSNIIFDAENQVFYIYGLEVPIESPALQRINTSYVESYLYPARMIVMEKMGGPSKMEIWAGQPLSSLNRATPMKLRFIPISVTNIYKHLWPAMESTDLSWEYVTDEKENKICEAMKATPIGSKKGAFISRGTIWKANRPVRKAIDRSIRTTDILKESYCVSTGASLVYIEGTPITLPVVAIALPINYIIEQQFNVYTHHDEGNAGRWRLNDRHNFYINKDGKILPKKKKEKNKNEEEDLYYITKVSDDNIFKLIMSLIEKTLQVEQANLDPNFELSDSHWIAFGMQKLFHSLSKSPLKVRNLLEKELYSKFQALHTTDNFISNLISTYYLDRPPTSKTMVLKKEVVTKIENTMSKLSGMFPSLSIVAVTELALMDSLHQYFYNSKCDFVGNVLSNDSKEDQILVANELLQALYQKIVVEQRKKNNRRQLHLNKMDEDLKLVDFIKGFAFFKDYDVASDLEIAYDTLGQMEVERVTDYFDEDLDAQFAGDPTNYNEKHHAFQSLLNLQGLFERVLNFKYFFPFERLGNIMSLALREQNDYLVVRVRTDPISGAEKEIFMRSRRELSKMSPNPVGNFLSPAIDSIFSLFDDRFTEKLTAEILKMRLKRAQVEQAENVEWKLNYFRSINNKEPTADWDKEFAKHIQEEKNLKRVFEDYSQYQCKKQIQELISPKNALNDRRVVTLSNFETLEEPWKISKLKKYWNSYQYKKSNSLAKSSWGYRQLKNKGIEYDIIMAKLTAEGANAPLKSKNIEEESEDVELHTKKRDIKLDKMEFPRGYIPKDTTYHEDARSFGRSRDVLAKALLDEYGVKNVERRYLNKKTRNNKTSAE